jgi:hypothetical protein
MKSKKITIVNITADDSALIKNEDIETVEEIIPESTDIKDEAIEQPVVHELKQIVKTTDLTECPKCHKMITNKTLKYSHAKTCGIVKPPVETPTIKQLPDADIPNVIKPVSAIKPRNTLKSAVVAEKPRSLSPKPTTLEEMRHNYYINARLQRTQKINKLFANAI